MSIWSIAPVAEQPESTLTDWQVMELPNGDRHLVGYAVEDKEGRASSAIDTFDLVNLRAVTSSGRVYQLRGRPGWNKDAEYVWKRWLRINDAAVYVDVSASVWDDSASARAGVSVRQRDA